MTTAPAKETGQLHLEVFASSPETFQVTSTLVYGDKDLILIDAQLTLGEARRLAEKIKATGKRLTTVYITHGHPDHYWGLPVLKEAFPAAKFVARPETIALINQLQVSKVAQWKPVYGDEIPDSPIIPEPLNGTALELEGNTLEIMNGQGDADDSTFLWIPSLKAIIAGDIVYDNVNIWVLETDRAGRKLWLDTLDRMLALEPAIVVGGHVAPGSRNGPAALAFTKRYLEAFDQAVESSRSAEELMARIKAAFPELNGLDMVLQMAADREFPK